MTNSRKPVDGARQNIRPSAAARRLIDASKSLLESLSPDEITTTMVLKKASVARNTLYLNFEDHNALLEAALLEIFTEGVDEHLRLLVASLSKAGNKNDFVKRIGDVIEISQDMRRRDFRVTRCRLIAHTDKNPRFSVLLGKEQVRINNDFTAFFLQLQARGWMGSKLSPATAAVIIQALTLGRTVDDVSADRLSPASWNEAFMTIVKDVILSSTAEQTGV